MRLPNAERAVIEPAKLRDYLLSEQHPVGRYKSVYFRSLGYTSERWSELSEAIRRLLVEEEAEEIERNAFGRKYRVAGTLALDSKRPAFVVSVWIVLDGEAVPRFITAFPGD